MDVGAPVGGGVAGSVGTGVGAGMAVGVLVGGTGVATDGAMVAVGSADPQPEARNDKSRTSASTLGRIDIFHPSSPRGAKARLHVLALACQRSTASTGGRSRERCRSAHAPWWRR